MKWEKLSTDDLLDIKMSDLKIKINDTMIEARLLHLYEELEERNIIFKPHAWLSDEWFSPDGVPGIAIPFYLAHPRLRNLEKQMMLEVEGSSTREFMRLLRHEAGHAISTAYHLHRKASWRKIFGKFSKPYPNWYRPKPVSKNYVLHLDWWYAQSHPAEDFAETFAVWLGQKKRWRQQYKDWPAFKKLEYVDFLMRGISNKKPVINTKIQIDSVSKLHTTLRQHYRQKRRRYADSWPDFYDRDLRRLFTDDPKFRRRKKASAFLREIRPEIRQSISTWTGEYQYTIDKVLKEMIVRCRELNLTLNNSEKQTKIDATLMVTVQTMNYLYGTRHWIAV